MSTPRDPHAPYPPAGPAAPPPGVPPTYVPPPGAWPGPDPYAAAPAPHAAPYAAAARAGGGRSRTVPIVVAGVLVVGLLAAVALWSTRTPSPAARPAASPVSSAPATSTRRPGPAPVRPTTAGAPTLGPAGTGPSTGLVTFSAPAAAHPQADTVLNLLDTHFRAINAHDYDGWVATVDPGRAADLPREDWTRAFRSTSDSDVAVSSIDDAGDDGVLVDLEFVSEQEVADAPPDLPAPRICWTSRWPVVDGRIGTPPRGATTKRAC